MKFLERIFGCFHDWEVIKYTTKSRLLSEIEEKIEKDIKLRSLIRAANDTPYTSKICLKCKMHIDEITPAYNELLTYYKNKVKNEKARKDKVKSILKELKIKE